MSYVRSAFLKNIALGKAGRNIAVEIVQETTKWKRPTDLTSAELKEEFIKVVEENSNEIDPKTAAIAMKEGEHSSGADQRPHFTVYQLDAEHKVFKTTHLTRKMDKEEAKD